MRSATPAWLVEQDRPRVGYAVLLFERNGMEMAQKWIDEQEAYNLGDTGFLVCNSHETEGWSRYHLRDTPAHTNVSRAPRLVGWCGSYNNISTHACGVWKVVRVAKNGRTLITETDADETAAFLDEMGYPDLTEDD